MFFNISKVRSELLVISNFVYEAAVFCSEYNLLRYLPMRMRVKCVFPWFYRRRYCGTSLPPVMTSISNVVTIRFHASSSLNNNGFSLSYHALNSESGNVTVFYYSSLVLNFDVFSDSYEKYDKYDLWKFDTDRHQ